MTAQELDQYITFLSESDMRNLLGLSYLDLDHLNKLVETAPSENQKKFVTVARYIHLGKKLAQAEEL